LKDSNKLLHEYEGVWCKSCRTMIQEECSKIFCLCGIITECLDTIATNRVRCRVTIEEL